MDLGLRTLEFGHWTLVNSQFKRVAGWSGVIRQEKEGNESPIFFTETDQNEILCVVLRIRYFMTTNLLVIPESSQMQATRFCLQQKL